MPFLPLQLGHAIVINNIATEFPGSRKDAEALVKTYELMNFDVTCYEDCTDTVSQKFFVEIQQCWKLHLDTYGVYCTLLGAF